MTLLRWPSSKSTEHQRELTQLALQYLHLLYQQKHSVCCHCSFNVRCNKEEVVVVHLNHNPNKNRLNVYHAQNLYFWEVSVRLEQSVRPHLDSSLKLRMAETSRVLTVLSLSPRISERFSSCSNLLSTLSKINSLSLLSKAYKATMRYPYRAGTPF